MTVPAEAGHIGRGHLTTLRARLRCPAVLPAVCVDATVAAWSAGPIELGHPGARLTPLVLGPERMPLVTDAAQAARHPQTAVLSALAHAADPPPHAVLDALMAAFAAVDEQHAGLYTDVVLAALPLVARRYLEELMSAGTYEYQSDFARRYFHQGQTDAMATAVLAVLAARSVDVPDGARARITDSADREQLDCWLRRAATAHSVAELFD